MKYIKTLSDFLNENVIIPPNIPNTKNYWHGGNLDNYNDIISQKNGRYEFGAGLYITTHYDTALKYSKGNRKLYLITVEEGNDIKDSYISLENITDFIMTYVIKSMRKLIFQRLEKYKSDLGIKAFIFNNIILNEKAIKSTNTEHLRNFYIDNNIDYEIVDNPFGWNEEMMVLYNMKKIVNIIHVTSKDKIEIYDLKK